MHKDYFSLDVTTRRLFGLQQIGENGLSLLVSSLSSFNKRTAMTQEKANESIYSSRQDATEEPTMPSSPIFKP